MNEKNAEKGMYETFLLRIIEQNKKEYTEAYKKGKMAMFLLLAQKDRLLNRQGEILSKHKLLKDASPQIQISKPKVDYNPKWTWISKIMFLLQERNCPLRSAQMIEYFSEHDMRMRDSHDRSGYFSAFLTKAVKNKRVVKIKEKGFKGFYYALPEWIVNGELPKLYYLRMNFFVSHNYY